MAYANGPDKFVMRYEAPGAESAPALGTNPWIDFSGDVPPDAGRRGHALTSYVYEVNSPDCGRTRQPCVALRSVR